MALKIKEKLNRLRASEQSIREEIAELSRLNRESPDAERERRLVRLRNDLYGRMARPEPEAGVPEQLAEVPVGAARHEIVDGVPEVAGAELDAATIRSAFLSHGCLLVRGLLDPERAEQLTGGIDQALESRDAYAEGSPSEQTTPWFEPFEPAKQYTVEGADWNRAKPGGGSVWASDSPRMLFELLDAFEEAGIQRVATDYLGERPTFSMNKSVLRRSPPGTGSAWHQDGAFLGEGIRTLNVWLALNHCGDTAPGLDVVAKRLDGVVETGTTGATFVWSVSDLLVDELLEGAPPASPIFEAGDALLFDHLCLHRTGSRPEMDRVRYATETWCFAPSAFPDELVPIVV